MKKTVTGVTAPVTVTAISITQHLGGDMSFMPYLAVCLAVASIIDMMAI